MRNGTSRTAEYVALLRGLESARPHPRLFCDPFAVHFLGRGLHTMVRLADLPALSRLIENQIDRSYPGGPRGSAIVRTRLIDDLAEDALANGIRQVVLLGAGRDSRAYRMPSMSHAAVFEVDHPATQAVKKARVERHVAESHRRHVRFVPLDFLHDDLAGALQQAGYRDLPTLVIWEGVTNYLDADSGGDTFSWFARVTAAGSRLIFTYIDVGVIDGTGHFSGMSEWAGAVRGAGEPFTFGFDPAALPAYVAGHGLRLQLDLSARDAAAHYLKPLGRNDPAATFYRIAEVEQP